MSDFPTGQMFKFNGNFFPLAQYTKLVNNTKTTDPKIKTTDPKVKTVTPKVEVKVEEPKVELTDVEVARDSYEKAVGTIVPSNKKNDIEWMEKKIKESKRSMV